VQGGEGGGEGGEGSNALAMMVCVTVEAPSFRCMLLCEGLYPSTRAQADSCEGGGDGSSDGSWLPITP